MASIKISQLPAGDSINSIDEFPVSRGGLETYRIRANQIVTTGSNVGGAAGVYKDSTAINSTTLNFRSLSGVGEGLQVIQTTNTINISISGRNPIKTVFTGTGSQVSFPFPLTNTSSRNINNYRVDIDGVLQEPGQTADYYLNGSNLTFTTAPPLGSKIVVVSNNLLPLAESVPAANSIINTMLTDGCINTPELSSGAVTTDKIALSAITAEKMSGGQTGNAPIFGTRAWVYFNGLSGLATLSGAEYRCALSAEGNVSKVVWLSAGQYNVHFQTALPANYAIIGSVEVGGNLETFIPRAKQSTSAIARVNTQRNGVFEDASEIHALFIG